MGKLTVNNVSEDSFSEFSRISKEFFEGRDRDCLDNLIQLFNLEKEKNKIMGGSK